MRFKVFINEIFSHNVLIVLEFRKISLSEIFNQGRRNWGGRRGSCPPCLLLGGARGAKVPFKYKEYYINSFRGAFS